MLDNVSIVICYLLRIITIDELCFQLQISQEASMRFEQSR